MCLIILRVVILSILFYQTTGIQNCDANICNHEALCILENDKPTCKCVGKFFEGEFCTKLIDHCTSNPCKNGGICHPYPGHYYCECTKGFSGQMCALTLNTFKGLHLHYNHIVAIGQEQPIILMIENLGKIGTLMDFFAADYMIDGFGFSASSGHFKPCNDLKSISRRLKIKHSETLPYNKGFCRITQATFWTLGLQKIIIDLSDAGISAENIFNGHFFIEVYNPSRSRCFPVIHLPNGKNPRDPLHMDIVTFNFLEPVVDKRCAEHSHLKINWSVKNYIGTVVLHRFPEDASTVLTIPPYKMWFNYKDDYVQSYLIQGHVIELNSMGDVISQMIIRCYTFVDSKPTTAEIVGGSIREVNINKEFIIDGSKSRDYARRRNSDQKLEYTWSCSSEDTKNRYCLKNMGKRSRFKIPARAFKLGQSYKFSLLVRSTINIYSTHRTYQSINAVNMDPLLVNFRCLRNCDHDMFAAEKIIHLKLECIGCPPGLIAYSVRNENDVEVATSHSVIITEKSKKEVVLKAEATLGKRKGMCSIRLNLNTPPTKGKCTVSPTSGVEFQTVFEIACPGYEDTENPIDYKYRVGNTTLDHSGNATLSTRLFSTSGQICEIKISICDDIGACTNVQLQVTLSAITPAESWLGLLSQNGSNLKDLIQNGDRSSAITLIRTVIPHMTADDSFDIAKHIVESLRDLELGRLLAVEQVLTVASDLFETLELASNTSALVSELFSNASEGLRHSIKDGEVNELPLETHEQMLGELAQSMAKMTAEVEEFPMIHDVEKMPPEDPFSENYTDYGELDIGDVVRISDWLTSFNKMHECLQILGVISAFIQLPDETALITKRKGITTMSLVIDTLDASTLSWNESTTFVSLPNEFLKSLKGKEIALQVSIFEANPIWWNPEQYKLNTAAISIGAYTKDLASIRAKSTKAPFTFFMELKGSPETEEGNIMHANVSGPLDMPIFEKLIPPNAVLVVTFMPVDKDIQILLTLGDKPRSHMLSNAKKIKTSSESTTFFIVNNRSGCCKAFLAITSDNVIDVSFSFYTRMCLTWNQCTFEWTSEHCSVGPETNITHIHCLCWHLSMFGGMVHSSFGILQPSRDIVDDLVPNYSMVVFYVVILILLILILLLGWLRDVTSVESLAVLNIKPRRRTEHRYVVTICTNGHAIAATTSNVTIQIHGSLSNSEQYTLYSNTYNSLFQRNMQTSFEIPSANSLGVLQSVSLHHDSFGRYPTWNCDRIVVRDVVKMKDYIFWSNNWLSDYESTTCSILVPLVKKDDLHREWQVFRDNLTDAFANWYAEQALCSLKLYGNLTALEKAAIFIVKICITLLGTMAYFGPTNMFNYDDERETYYSMLLDFGELFLIGLCSHFVGCIVGAALQYLFLKLRSTQRKARVVYQK